MGIWLFLASEIMLFGGLFSAFVLLRVGAPIWPQSGETHLNIFLATLNTFNLILSSWTIVKSWISLKENDLKGFKGPLKSKKLTKQILQESDCVILTADHDDFDYDQILEISSLIVDTRGKFPKNKKVKLA